MNMETALKMYYDDARFGNADDKKNICINFNLVFYYIINYRGVFD